jgi:Xaa-Pro aminopeptidase
MEGEAPWIETSSDFLLEKNMAFCVDIFLGSNQTQTGIRIEDVVLITDDGVEDLTNYKRELFEIL